MATKPTRQQQQACDQFAEALVLITEGARLDGKGTLDPGDLAEIAGRLAKASSFPLDEIVSRALERRGRQGGSRALLPGRGGSCHDPGGRGLPIADGGGMGVCLPRGGHDEVQLWR